MSRFYLILWGKWAFRLTLSTFFFASLFTLLITGVVYIEQGVTPLNNEVYRALFDISLFWFAVVWNIALLLSLFRGMKHIFNSCNGGYVLELFSCEKEGIDNVLIERSKQDKIDQINTLELKPKFVRFSYEKGEISAAYVAFQKEVFAKKWNMLHITEMAFTIRASNFDEFESMSGVHLKTDFKDLTEVAYEGEERRKEQRTST